MNKFTLADLRLADELAFPERMEKLFYLYFPDCNTVFYNEWLNRFNRSFTAWIFNWSRADLERNNSGLMIENMICDLIHKN